MSRDLSSHKLNTAVNAVAFNEDSVHGFEGHIIPPPLNTHTHTHYLDSSKERKRGITRTGRSYVKLPCAILHDFSPTSSMLNV